MKRRGVLATVPVVFSGCMTVPGGNQSSKDDLRIEPVVRTESEDYSINVDVETSDAKDVIAVARIAVENTGQGLVKVTSGAPGPFGKLVGYSKNDDSAIPFWTQVYEREMPGFEAEDHRLTSWVELEMTQSIEPGKKLEGKYSIRKNAAIGTLTTNISDGTYQISLYEDEPFEVDGSPADIELSVQGWNE